MGLKPSMKFRCGGFWRRPMAKNSRIASGAISSSSARLMGLASPSPPAPRAGPWYKSNEVMWDGASLVSM